MDLSFSDADLAFQTKVRTFIDEHLPKGQALWTKRSEWFKALADQGGMGHPQVARRIWRSWLYTDPALHF